MIFFIPAWYSKKEWRENEQVWYERRAETEFDDTVKQIQLFHRNKAYPYEVVILSYAPNLRHFLHRQGVMRARYWSCFDAIQTVRRKKASVISLYDLTWPKGIEFVYTPFAVVAFLDGEKYAQIEFGEYGNMIRVALYNNGSIVRTNVYDDRGFVSSTIVWKNGEKLYEHFLDENGKWKICHFADGHVEINPHNNRYIITDLEDKENSIEFAKSKYADLSELIEEVFNSFINTTSKEDIFCIAMSPVHTKILMNVLGNNKTILSFYKNRISLRDDSAGIELLDCANEIVADSFDTKKRIVAESDIPYQQITEISPFDSRVDFGISQQLHVQNILVPIDELGPNTFDEVIAALAKYLPGNQYARVHLFTRKVLSDGGNGIRTRIQQILEEMGLEPEWAAVENDNRNENELVDNIIKTLFIVDQCVDELSASKCLREQRIVVDLQNTPDLFIQISSISMGIPQINAFKTRYLEPGENGKICDDISKLPEILKFYLDDFNNWNKAKICSYKIGKQYTSSRLSEQWKEVIGRIEQN